MSLRSKLGTAAAVVLYATLMICTNNIYTILDDESTIIAVAGHPISSTVKLFLSGKGQHEHPPVSDLLLHLWLVATGYSFFSLRIFANIFYIGAVLFIAFAAKRIGGKAAYWTALLVAFAWPFAFQYARLTGWYAFCAFLVAWLTWIYLRTLEDQGPRPWIAFGIVGVLLV